MIINVGSRFIDLEYYTSYEISIEQVIGSYPEVHLYYRNLTEEKRVSLGVLESNTLAEMYAGEVIDSIFNGITYETPIIRLKPER